MKKRVAFQGLSGAYSEIAIRQHFGDVLTEGMTSFRDVHEALKRGQVDDALLPFENSVAGTIQDNFELMLDSDLRICGETVLRVEHCVLALPDARVIRRIRSHPQALAQCLAFIVKQGWVAEDAFDTAGAARELAENPTNDCAVLASEEAARLYGLDVLYRDVADRPGNRTRFLHLRRDPLPHKKEKGSRAFVIVTETERGAFHDFLASCIPLDLAARMLHLSATRQEAWAFHYSLELSSKLDPSALEATLAKLAGDAWQVKVLGTFGIKV